ncbi:hypothetical protein EYF80_063506 [Liparis tanakae]|uniref:Uncharacterized protein n=1 Tax=Liparis tanakae TaxID=230148 RepID=A0A4Z2EBU6_9TELE|nr:hypothetical protein EYF80_063506 [Liparis tanakae]
MQRGGERGPADRVTADLRLSPGGRVGAKSVGNQIQQRTPGFNSPKQLPPVRYLELSSLLIWHFLFDRKLQVS